MTNNHLRRRLVAALAVLGTVVALGVVAVPLSASADSGGTPMWNGTDPYRFMGSPRAIRLAHSGSAYNGELIGTFESSQVNGASEVYDIQKSTDDGRTWSTLATVSDQDTSHSTPYDGAIEGSLYEFPQAIGSHPAGTLVLIGDIVNLNGSGPVTSTEFQEWQSYDHGATWTPKGVIQTGGGDRDRPGGGGGTGIWEPFVDMNGAGQLEIYFSDERFYASGYDQTISQMYSNDGGDTWSATLTGGTNTGYSTGLTKIVGDTTAGDRPGMPSIAVMGNGTRILMYEGCFNDPGCPPTYKLSTDGGATWAGSGGSTAATNHGIKAEPSDTSVTLGSAPYVSWSPAGGPNGTIMVTSHGYAGGTAIEVNTSGGTEGSPWGWVVRPLSPYVNTPASGAWCNINYSNAILPSTNGFFDRVLSAAPNSAGDCSIMTDTANMGILPYNADFSTSRDRGWLNMNTSGAAGCWSVSGGVYSLTCATDGDKSITGNSAWTDYTVQTDVRLDSTPGSATAGVYLRLTDPQYGAHNDVSYFAGVSGSNLVFLKDTAGTWTSLGTAAIPGGLAQSTWYHIEVQASGCTFEIQGAQVGATSNVARIGGQPNGVVTDTGCTATSGAVGVGDFGGTAASWRNFDVTPGAAPGGYPGFYLAPFATVGAAGWSAWGSNPSTDWTADTAHEKLLVASGPDQKGLNAGSYAWTNETVESDVALTTVGSTTRAGVLLRSTSAGNGLDQFYGYSAELTSTGLSIDRDDNGTEVDLGDGTLPGGIVAGTEYHLTAVIHGCAITATAVSLSDPSDEVQATASDCTYPSGAVGVRAQNTAASWRQFTTTFN